MYLPFANIFEEIISYVNGSVLQSGDETWIYTQVSVPYFQTNLPTSV
jgi:hypothetical protein